MAARWRFFADTGGTFTDFLAVDPAGALHRAKVLSTGAVRVEGLEADGARLRVVLPRELPGGFWQGWTARALAAGEARRVVGSGEGGWLTLDAPFDAPPPFTLDLSAGLEAPVTAARLVTGAPLDQPLPPHDLRLATTRGTNALLERRGVQPALFVTRGFADLLLIGDQTRPDLFAIDIQRPAPLFARAVEVTGRLDAAGREIEPLDEEQLRRDARDVLASGPRTAAVALMHSYLDPAHEERAAAILGEEGFTHVSVSSRLSPMIRLLPRARTAVVNAYLAPVVNAYLGNVARQCGGGESRMLVMTSAGGLVAAGGYEPKDSLLSGPAGGVVGAAAAGGRLGIERLVAFDMGGTSTDVSRFDGDFHYDFEHAVGDALVQAPALAIASVAAGGGSICAWDGVRLSVGPESAGADPGPACYGAGGPLAVTDVNVLLGRAPGFAFSFPIRPEQAEARVAEMEAAMAAAGRAPASREALLAGLLAIANETMAAAIRGISLRQGYDPADHALVAFGGAGGQNACELAELLGMRVVVSPRDASLLSAVGLAEARVERVAARQVLRPLAELAGELPALVDELAAQACAEVQADTGEEAAPRRVLVELRHAGQDFALPLEWSPGADLAPEFHERHAQVYGFTLDDRPIEVVAVRVFAAAPEGARLPASAAGAAGERSWPSSARVWDRAGWTEAAVVAREGLQGGERVAGPALIVDPMTTLFLPSGWVAEARGGGDLVARRG